MITTVGLLLTALAYLGLLFGIAYYADWMRARGQSVINNATIYSLSLAIYCTGWTFYGSVGLAAKDGLMFLPIYLGPTLLAFLWVFLLRKIIRICKRYSITSIADFISSRYGKDPLLGGIVTIIAVVGILPYIALQLKAIGTSFDLMVGPGVGLIDPAGNTGVFTGDATFYIALVLIVFTILFGVRQLDATERHEGMVAAIAFESLVKLMAFLLVGFFVVYGLFDGFADLFGKAQLVPEIKTLWSLENRPHAYEDWMWLGLLAMLAIVLLPRQFQISVIENVDENHVYRGIWLFPLYLLAINIFVLPLAVAGRLYFPDGDVNADTFVLTLPLADRNLALAWLVFIGGLSAAASMIVVEAVALSIMICNSLVIPLLIRFGLLRTEEGNTFERLLLGIRRGSVVVILLFSYLYFRMVIGTHSLVSIGLVSFLAVAQFAPAVIGGLYWKNATRQGALFSLLAGFAVWAYTLPFGQMIESGLFSSSILDEGLFGLTALRPLHLFGMKQMGPISQAAFWSLSINLGCYIGISLFTRQTALERGQANLFVDIFRYSRDTSYSRLWRGTATNEELRQLLQRFLGSQRTNQVIREFARQKGLDPGRVWQADAELVQYTETLLSGVIGSVSARILVAAAVKEEALHMDEVMEILDATQQVIAYSQQLEEKSQQLQAATEDLRQANLRLTEMDALKDEFISTITHELRTPLTSIRAFSEILHDTEDLEPDKRQEFLAIIIQETERLTRLIGQVLELEKMESGTFEWVMQSIRLRDVISRALNSVHQLLQDKEIKVSSELGPSHLSVYADQDRLTQVIVNLLSNAIKFCPEEGGRIWISVKQHPAEIEVRVRDNGIGIPVKYWTSVFEKFNQGEPQKSGKPAGSGLGLSISKNIIEHHGGRISVAPGSENGAIFQFFLPLSAPESLQTRTMETVVGS